MTFSGWTLILVFVALVVALARPAGAILHRLYEDRPLPLEAALLRVIGSRSGEQSWVGYAISVLVFNIAGIGLLFAMLKLQGVLPLNPQGFDPT